MGVYYIEKNEIILFSGKWTNLYILIRMMIIIIIIHGLGEIVGKGKERMMKGSIVKYITYE
jgi:hypothetical protein